MPSTTCIPDISERNITNGGGGNGGLNHYNNGTRAPTPVSTTAAAALKGTAAGGKWSDYADIKAAPSIIKRRRTRVLTLTEKLTAAVTATANVRLFFAILQGILLFSAWNLASQSAPGSWTLSWQQRAFNKAFTQLKSSAYRGNLRPALKTYKAVTTSKFIIVLKQPQWAALAATAQHHPMSILFIVNLAFILPTYLFLVLSKNSSSLGNGRDASASSHGGSSFILWKVISMVAPALQSQVAHALAIKKLLSSIIDCAVVTVVTLGVCQLVEQLLKVKIL
jgi:hypothetical protein